MFWNKYPLPSLFSPSVFSSYPFERSAPLSIPDTTVEHITSTAPLQIQQEICDFLKRYFRLRAHTPHKDAAPQLSFTPHTLFENREKDHLFTIRANDTLIGTVRYHWIGYLITYNHPILYLVDCLCVHPLWREKGITNQLLTELHRYANEHNLPHALFLKEGRPLLSLPLPLYSSYYVYRKTTHKSTLLPITSKQASHWISLYLILYPHTVMIWNPNTANATWILYRHQHHRILACIQNTHQTYPATREKMGWVTAWLETDGISNEIRQRASLEISDSVSVEYPWMWMDGKWSGGSEEWKMDGGFHWYTYQWGTSKRISQSYGILI